MRRRRGLAPVGHCRDRGGITHAPRPCSWPDTTAALDSESAVRSATGMGGPGACHSCAAQARGPRLLGPAFLGHPGLFFVTVLRPRRGRPGPARWHAAVSTPRPPGPGRSRAPGVVGRRTAMGRDRSLRRSARLGWARRCMRDFNSIQQVCSDVRAHAALDCQCSRSP
jgi:hypothetical protein